MSEYWQARRDVILAMRDYALAFDLTEDLARQADLSESMAQLWEIAIQAWFIGYTEAAAKLVEQAKRYGETICAQQEASSKLRPSMAFVYQRLFYAHWWRGQEQPGLLACAAEVFMSEVEAFAPDLWDIYLRAALFWLEAGDASQGVAWADRCLRALAHLRADAWAHTNLEPAMPLMRACAQQAEGSELACAVARSVSQASDWGGGRRSLMLAIQLAGIQHSLLAKYASMAELLASIR